jgi:hypothetical protein
MQITCSRQGFPPFLKLSWLFVFVLFCVIFLEGQHFSFPSSQTNRIHFPCFSLHCGRSLPLATNRTFRWLATHCGYRCPGLNSTWSKSRRRCKWMADTTRKCRTTCRWLVQRRPPPKGSGAAWPCLGASPSTCSCTAWRGLALVWGDASCVLVLW